MWEWYQTQRVLLDIMGADTRLKFSVRGEAFNSSKVLGTDPGANLARKRSRSMVNL